MPDHFINLNCANCGAKLEVYDDMDRFACGYCGTEMLVQRRGGTVALKAVTEAIKKVQIGTDKTAAELALVRLGKELEELKAHRSQVENTLRDGDKSTGCFIWVLLLGSVVAFVLLLLVIAFVTHLGPTTIHEQWSTPGDGEVAVALGCVVVMCIGALVWWFKSEAAGKRKLRQTLPEIQSQIDEKEHEIERTRKTVQG